jgi:hypothetical protein
MARPKLAHSALRQVQNIDWQKEQQPEYIMPLQLVPYPGPIAVGYLGKLIPEDSNRQSNENQTTKDKPVNTEFFNTIF